MKIKLYESLNTIISEYFELGASEQENFKNFVRSNFKDNEIIKKLSDDYLYKVINTTDLDFSDPKLKELMKDVLYNYQQSLKGVSDRKFLAALYFYTNNFPIVWNSYISGDFESNQVYNSKEIKKRIKALKDIYIKALNAYVESLKVKLTIKVEDEIENKIENELEDRINKKNITSDEKDNVLKDIYVYFKKNKIKERMRSQKNKKIEKTMSNNKKITLIKRILSSIDNNKKINQKDLILLNGNIINDESTFIENIHHKESIFGSSASNIDNDPRDLMTDFFSILNLELNNSKHF
jgi:hypothetical protein